MTTTVTERQCQHCHDPLPEGSRSDRRYCSDSCRMAAFQERQEAAQAQLIEQELDASPSQLDQLRAALSEAVKEERLLAVIAREAQGGNWRAAAWLLSRAYPQLWGERGRDVPFTPADDPGDPMSEFDELAERRQNPRKPPGY